ncbi:MAG: T9SS type A sorting domain-containing protein [Bacteroidota bacterium]
MALFFSFQACLLNAQPIPLYGTTSSGEKYNDGGFFELNNGTVRSTPFRKERAFPTFNFISHQGKVYGMCADVGTNYPPKEWYPIQMDSINGSLLSINSQLALTEHSGGFSVGDNRMAMISRNYVVAIDLATYAIDTIDYLPPSILGHRPLIYNKKCFYFKSMELKQYDFNTKTITSVGTINPTGSVSSPIGSLIAYGKFIYARFFDGSSSSLVRINLNTAESKEVGRFDDYNTSATQGQIAQSLNFCYLTTESGANQLGSLIRLNVKTGEVKNLHNFDSTAYRPISGTTVYRGKIYGLLSDRQDKYAPSLFEFDPATLAVKIIMQLDHPQDDPFTATSLFVHRGKMYAVDPSAGTTGTGSLREINVPNLTRTTIREYTSASINGFSIFEKPIYYNNQFFGASDSILYSINAETLAMEPFYTFQEKEVSPTPSHSLTVKGDIMYGLRETKWTYYEIFSLNLITKEYSVLTTINSGFGHNDEFVIVNNHLFIDTYKYDDIAKIIRINLATLEITETTLPFHGWYYAIAKLAVHGNEIYIPVYSSAKGSLVKLDPVSMEATVDEYFQSLNDTIDQVNIVEHDNKLYGISKSGESHYLFEYIPGSQSYKRLHTFQKPGYNIYRINCTNGLIHGAVDKDEQELRSNVFTWSIDDSKYNEYSVSESSELKGTIDFVVSKTSRLTEVKEKRKDSSLSLAPNPASYHFSAALERPSSGTWSIFDLAGKQVANGIFSDTTTIAFNTYLNTGIYIVKVLTNQQEIYEQKVLIEN